MALINNIKSVSIEGIGKLSLSDKPGGFTPASIKREPKPGRLPQDGGFVETWVQAKLELNLNMMDSIDIDALNSVSDKDVTVRLASGAVYLLSKAFCSDPVGVDDGDSKYVLMSNTSEKISQ